MAIATTVETDGERAVVVKRGTDADAERLRLEGERLERARHPGVVPVLRSEPAGEGWELCTAHRGRPVGAMGTADPLSVPQVARLAAAVASTLADLHDLGLVHGRIDATHVLVGEHGRAVVCGLGDGTTPARPEDDVAAVGMLLVGLLSTDEAVEPIPDRRWRGRRAWSGWERRALLLLADQAVADPADRRPTARRLAAAITDAVPSAARVDDGPPSDDVDPIERLRATGLADVPSRVRPARALVTALAGALLLAAGGLRVLAADAPAPDASPTGGAGGDAPPVDAALERHTAAPLARSELTADGRRYRVGQPGDVVLVDDWDCDGLATPALLRPGTGEVFVFPAWAREEPVAVEPVLQVVGAEALISESAAGACPTLSVRTFDQALVPVIEAG